MPDCTHEKETLIHGMEGLIKVRDELDLSGKTGVEWGFVAGVLNTLRDHEANEVDLTKEAHELLKKAVEQETDLSIDIIAFQEQFVSRAMDKLLACECGKQER